MTTARGILFANFDVVVTMDDTRREIPHGYVLVEGNKIKAVGANASGIVADEVIDGAGKVLLPGFVNTHHHLYQTLFRSIPGAAYSGLFDWLSFLYEKWKRIDEEAVCTSAIVGCCELLLSGATTTSDHFYIFPHRHERIFDALIEGGQKSGIRFHPCRGSMSLSERDGGLPPESVVQRQDEILSDSQRVIECYHDPSPFSMLRVALAPCSPFSVTQDLMRETIRLADEYDVLLHTHLAETADEERFCVERCGSRPIDLMEELGWLRDNVWFAHLVHLSQSDIDKLGKAQVGMSYCPSSNMLLGSGISPIRELDNAGVKISIGVDGSASNDTSNMIGEVRQAMLLQRVRYGVGACSARDALHMATIGGARVLHRDQEIGSVEVGKAADLITFDLSGIGFAGAHSDPVAAIVQCGANHVDLSMVNGQIKVQGGRLVNEELYGFIPRHNELSKKLINGG